MLQSALVLARIILIFAAVSAPLIALGWIGAGEPGAALGAATGICVAMGIALAAEHLIAHHFGTVFSPLQATLEKEWQAILSTRQASPRNAPKIVVFADPAPAALFARAVAGRGTLLLSQGFLATARDAELRSVLSLAQDRAHRPGALLQAYCASWIALVLRVAPRSWSRALLGGRGIAPEASLSVASALLFSTCFAISRFFARMSGTASQGAPLESLHLLPRDRSVRLEL